MMPETQLELARTRWAQGDQVAAISYYRSAATNDNEGRRSAEAGWALLESGDLQAAQAMLERAAALRPADGRVLYDLGRCYEIQGAPTRAFEWFMQAAHVAPSPSTLRATGRIARILGERTMARQMLARPLYIDRHNGETAAEIGRLHLGEQRPDLAARMLQRANMAGVEDVEVQRDLAEALLQLHNPRGALAIFGSDPDRRQRPANEAFARLRITGRPGRCAGDCPRCRSKATTQCATTTPCGIAGPGSTATCRGAGSTGSGSRPRR